MFETDFRRRCANCNRPFTSDNPRRLYCRPQCKKAAHNRRYYERHRGAVIAAVIARARRARRVSEAAQ